eukprot:TRINITY_DN11453_c0_g1_i1.p2 TRINITY_DN11453_c0_g1~~TRINITY_DN11453_c0_g1_i1.p2  ORF type:complete len:110 (+),score=17.17 TRINITY_DN11453_c0_g1_i1:535-864(+)
MISALPNNSTLSSIDILLNKHTEATLQAWVDALKRNSIIRAFLYSRPDVYRKSKYDALSKTKAVSLMKQIRDRLDINNKPAENNLDPYERANPRTLETSTSSSLASDHY